MTTRSEIMSLVDELLEEKAEAEAVVRAVTRDRRQVRDQLQETTLRANDVIAQLAAGTGDRETLLRRWGLTSGNALQAIDKSRRSQERGK